MFLHIPNRPRKFCGPNIITDELAAYLGFPGLEA